MKSLKQWLDEYSASHLNPVNKKLHWLCVPPIVFTVFVALKAIPVGGDWINAATIGGALALLWYTRLSWQLAAGIAAVFVPMYAGILMLEQAMGIHMIWLAAGIFVAAWIGQFIGHHYEGAKPSFFKDLQFLLVGPLWLMAFVYRRLDIPMGPGALPSKA